MKLCNKITLFFVFSVGFIIPIQAAELADNVPFVQGIYADKADCPKALTNAKAGKVNKLDDAVWYLEAGGFTDSYEASCSFYTVFHNANDAIAHTVCVAEGNTYPVMYYLERDPDDGAQGSIFVYTAETEEGQRGQEFTFCGTKE